MKKGHERTWEISVYNAYNRKNPYFYSFTSNYDPRDQSYTKNLTRYSLLGAIPAVSYSFKF